MCGISGYISKQNRSLELERSLETIKHRGPDANGSFFHQKNDFFIGLGHVRLSIIDVSKKAHQPMRSECGQYILIFNGEIYNFLELKEDLISNGFHFKTTSDSEVLLKYYMHYGVEGFTKLDGMFAFTILDRNINKLFLVRDHLGIKPVYFWWKKDSQEFYFSSEIKGLKPFSAVDLLISEQDIYEFFNLGWVFEPNTGYKTCKKVRPGHYLEIDLTFFHLKEKSFYNYLCKPKSNRIGLDNLLIKNINNQLMSDVPLGLFFSGGNDSSLIGIYSNEPLNAISVAYSEKETNNSGFVNDTFYIQQISQELGLNLDLIEFNEKPNSHELILESFKKVACATEELICDYTYIPSEEISRISKNFGYKVMLSGMGGDEVFGGYPRHMIFRYYYLFGLLNILIYPFLYFIRKSKKYGKLIGRFRSVFQEKHFGVKYARLLGYFSTKELNSLFHEKYSLIFEEKLSSLLSSVSGLSMFKKQMHLDFQGSLPHNLAIADKSSMAASIEMRVPLLSKDIVTATFHTKESTLINKGVLKYPIKKMLAKRLNRKLVNRPKTGFNPPLDDIISHLGKEIINKILNESMVFKYLLPEGVNAIINEHFDRKQNNTYKIWQLLYFSFWLDENANE